MPEDAQHPEQETDILDEATTEHLKSVLSSTRKRSDECRERVSTLTQALIGSLLTENETEFEETFNGIINSLGEPFRKSKEPASGASAGDG